MTQRIVVITGSAGGIGTAMSNRFAEDGDIVVGLDLAHGFDLTQPQHCHDAIDKVIAQHGRIDVLCNNAGISSVGDVVDSTLDDWQRVFAVNVFGIANMSRAALPHMRKRSSGFIVNTCSIAATVGLVERAVYSASKGAVLSLTKAMAADEIAHNVRVNCVSPGTVSSPWVERLVATTPDPSQTMESLRKRQPMGRLVECEEVAEAVFYLASPSNFTTGMELLIDGGISGVRIVQ